MKFSQICKIAGLISGIIAVLLMIGGLIGLFSGEFLSVRRYSNFFWFANTFLFLGIFFLLIWLGDKEKSA